MSQTPLQSARLGGPPDLIISASRVVTPTGIRPAEVHIRDGVITAVTAFNDRTAVPRGPRSAGPHGTAARVSPPGQGLISGSSRNHIRLADDEVLIPGLVDTHVHVNEPGRTDWEGFATATAAAAAGGITTIIDMPLNSIPPTINVAALDAKREAAAGQCGPGQRGRPARVARRRRLRFQVLHGRLGGV